MARKSEKALILIAILLAAATVSGLSRFLKAMDHTQSREGIEFEVVLPTHNPGCNILCYQRCLLNSIDRNSGGNSTEILPMK